MNLIIYSLNSDISLLIFESIKLTTLKSFCLFSIRRLFLLKYSGSNFFIFSITFIYKSLLNISFILFEISTILSILSEYNSYKFINAIFCLISSIIFLLFCSSSSRYSFNFCFEYIFIELILLSSISSL